MSFLSTPVKLAIAAWLIAEALVFILVVEAIGLPEAVLVGVLTSLFGWTLLKRAGASAMIKLRAALDGRRTIDGAPHRFVDETLTTFAAIALLVPGFLSDLVLGPTFGPVLGGFITDNFSWHWIFFVNVPIGTLATVLSWKYVTNMAGASKPKKIDWWGIIFLIIGIGSLQYVLEEGGADDWFESGVIVFFFVTAVVGTAAFIIRELSIDYPAVDLSLYKSSNLIVGNILNMVIGLIINGSVFIFPLFVQISLGWTATQTGAFMI